MSYPSLPVLGAALLIGSVAHGEILFDAASSASVTTTGSSLSWSHTIGSGAHRLLVVSVGIEEQEASNQDCVVSSVTYNGAAMTQALATDVTSTSVYSCVSLWYLVDGNLPAAGTYTVALTTAGAVTEIVAGATSLRGAMQGAPEASASSTCTSCSDTISTGVTTLSPWAWVVSAAVSGNASTFSTTGASQTERFDVAGATASAAGSTTPVVVAGSSTSSWTQGSANRMAQVVAAFAPADSTVSFQDGVSPGGSYSGAQDTYMSVAATTTNYGTTTPLQLDGAGEDAGVLMKFDVTSIPATSVVLSAELEVTVENASASTYNAYEMLQNWVVSQATWNRWATSSNWTTAGAQGAGTDRGSTVLGSLTGSTGKQTLTFNTAGIALVQRWVQSPGGNYGITLQAYSNSDGLDFSSDDHATAANRPRLTVTYRPRRVVIVARAGLPPAEPDGDRAPAAR